MSTATYARRKAEGRCGRCGERAPRDAGTLCQSCCDGTRARAAMERAHDRAKRRCLFKGCDNRHYANGYCAGHSCQIRQGRPLAPLQEQRQWTDEELANVVRWRGEGRRWTWIAAALVATMGQMRGLMARKKALAGLTCREAPVSLLDWEPAPNDELPDPDEATALPEALERCPRCFLCLPHDGCLPGAYEVASRRPGGCVMPFQRDKNHAAILAGLKAAGCRVRDVAALPGMGCDLIVARGDRGHGPVFLEIKNPAKPPSARKLTFSEETLQRLFPESFYVVLTLEQAFAAVGLSL